MSHFTKAILWLLCAVIMAVCCYIDVMEQSWFAFVVCAIAFVCDIINTFVQFTAWSQEQGRKDTQKKENENDT